MARAIVVTRNGTETRFAFARLDRSKLYGQRRRLPLDPEGEVCARAELTEGGDLLLQAGMTGQGYFNAAGEWTKGSDLVGLDADDQPMELIGTTLDQPEELVRIEPEEVLNVRLKTVYMLDAEEELDAELLAELQAGAVYRFAFNYRPDYRSEVGILVANDNGVFALIGVDAPPSWLALDAPPALPEWDDQADDDDDFDFEMF